MFDFIQKMLRLKLRFEFEASPAAATHPAEVKEKTAAQAPVQVQAQAHFEIIGLDSVREKYATHWQAIRERVHQIVRLIIKKHLSEGENFDSLPPEQYVVTFNRNSAESTIAAERIRQSIITVFLKDTQLMEHLDISVRVTELKPANEHHHAGHAKPHEPAHKTGHHEKPLYIRASVPDSHIHLRSASRMETETRHRPPMVRDEDGTAILPSPIQFPIRPVWNLGKDVPGCFSATTRYVMGDGTILEGYDVLPEEADEEMILELDLRMLRKLRIAMNTTRNSCGTPSKMLCPVHYKTVSDEKRAAVYAEAFKTLREDGLGDYISLQLMHMPRALYGADLEKPIKTIWQMTTHLVVMTQLDRSERDGLAQAGVTAVGLDLSHYADTPLQALQLRMRHYTKIANRERMRTFVVGLGREDLVGAAKAAGFTHLCGDAMAHAQAAPAGAACAVQLSQTAEAMACS